MIVVEKSKIDRLFRLVGYRVSQDLQFSRIFLVDLAAGAALVASCYYYLVCVQVGVEHRMDDFFAAGLALGFQVAKIFAVVDLERRGGSARQFYGSDQLVTDGLYSMSRNPTYVLSLCQSAMFAILLAILAGNPDSPKWGLYVAPLILIAHFFGIEKLVIPHEEAALAERHPEAYARYKSRVRRWIGHY